ncbi:MAG TPA: ATP-binding protein [Pyrinomonadaceae bacterium]|nr:ATP-binding protein [Pyrinomonadaceae bacterium]
MSDQSCFDSCLLARPWKERMQYFNSYMANHRRLNEVDKQIMAALKEPAGAGFMFVIGPTGIGKTTARKVIYRRIINQAAGEMLADPGYLPIAGFAATTHGSNRYNWHDHWVRSLEALNEPLIEHKKLFGTPTTVEVHWTARLRERLAALRRSFETSAKIRRLRTFLIDEAHHLTYVSDKMLRYQLEAIKSAADESEAMHVLFGTYELLLLRNASGQLGRRAITVHFDRYRAESDDDITSFVQVIKSFQVQMPLVKAPDLLPHAEYCFERSLGCVGLLKDWFSRSLADVLENNAKTLTYRHLQKHEYPASVLLAISTEFLKGEDQLSEAESTFALIKERLGIGIRQRKAVTKKGKQNTDKTTPHKSKHTFAKQKPKRDKVGEARVKSVTYEADNHGLSSS